MQHDALTPAAVLDILTLRQVQILRLVAEGYTNKEIGEKLDLAEKSVRNQLSYVYASLGVNNRVQAARWALWCGIGSLEPGPHDDHVLWAEEYRARAHRSSLALAGD